jgi:hypothetical protein
MGYSDKTYVIFDGDNDMWAYARMKGWNALHNIDFNFYDAHEVFKLTDRADDEDYIKSILKKRFAEAKQVILLIGDKTKNLFKYVRWELDVAIGLDLPIIAVNLNGKREMDNDLCPPIIKEHFVVHVSYKMRIIKHALDNFPRYYNSKKNEVTGDHFYNDSIYKSLGIDDE